METREDRVSGSESSKTAMQIASTLAGDVYKDGLQPSIKTLGETLAGIFKAIGHYPRYWGMMSDISLELKHQQFKEKLEAKVAAIPEANKTLPKPNILGPSIQALEYAIFEEHMSEMFANLLASSMDSSKSQRSHPSFVEIIKQLTGDEAKLLKFMSGSQDLPVVDVNKCTGDDGVFETVRHKYHTFSRMAGCDSPENYQEMIENLERMKLIEVKLSDLGGRLSDITLYQDVSSHAEKSLGIKIKDPSDSSSNLPGQHFLTLGYMHLTAFGTQFIDICSPQKE